MYGIITEDYVDSKNNNKSNELKINLAQVYLILLLLSGGGIYFYSVYQDDYLQLLIPYTVIWPISLILIGISIFRVKNTASFSVGFFITALSVGFTIVLIFVYSTNVKAHLDTKLISIKDTKQLALEINLVATDAKIKSDNKDILVGDFNSNYEMAKINNYKDENKIENIKFSQVAFPPGLGFYNKSTNISVPKSIPAIYDINMNLVRSSIDLSGIDLISANFDIQNSQVEITIQNLDIKNDSKLDIKSRLSNIDLVISKDVEVDFINNSDFSQVSFEGMVKKNSDKDQSIYRTDINIQDEVKENLEDKDKLNKKKLIISLNSTLSNIKITQK